MSLNGAAIPAQMAMMTRVFEEHCREIGIEPGSSEYQNVAIRVMLLFNCGVTTSAELKKALGNEAYRG